MAIPDFQSIMLPLLQFCADSKEHTNRDAIDHLAKDFDLSEEEQKNFYQVVGKQYSTIV